MQNEESLRLDSMSKIVGVLCVIVDDAPCEDSDDVYLYGGKTHGCND